jgi:thymidylate synthase (FAD)
VNYSKDKYGNEITVIEPLFFDTESLNYKLWYKAMQFAEAAYMDMIENGATPQESRSVLPNSTKTEIVVTMNLREWRHFFKLRTAQAAHPQMREVAIPLLKELQNKLTEVFEDIEVEG